MKKVFYVNSEYEANLVSTNEAGDKIIVLAETADLLSAIAGLYQVDEDYNIVPQDIIRISYDTDDVQKMEDTVLPYVLFDKAEISVPMTEQELDEFVKNNISTCLNHDSDIVRAFTLSLGYGLEKALDDNEPICVIAQAVKRKYKLDVFKSSRIAVIRVLVAKVTDEYEQELSEDSSAEVRAAVASVTKNKVILVKYQTYEEDIKVKLALVRRDIGSAMLCNDLSKNVRQVVAENTADRTILDILLHDESDKVKSKAYTNKLITEQDCLDGLKVDENGAYVNNRYIRMAIATKAIEEKWTDILEELAVDGAAEVRMLIAQAGYCRDILLKDSNAEIRRTAYLTQLQ